MLLLTNKKGLWVWNWVDLADKLYDLMQEARCQYTLIKTHEQGWLYRRSNGRVAGIGDAELVDVIQHARSYSELVGGWGYFTFEDVQSEGSRALDTIHAGADFYAFNIEDRMIEIDPETPWKAEQLFNRIRSEVGWDYPLFFTSHVQPSYHERQPYYQAVEAGIHQMPMCYHNAMQMAPAKAVEVMYAELAKYNLLRNGVECVPAGGAYSTPEWNMGPSEIIEWANAAIQAGAPSLNWWAADSLITRPDLVAAIAQVAFPEVKEDEKTPEALAYLDAAWGAFDRIEHGTASKKLIGEAQYGKGELLNLKQSLGL